MKLIFWILLVIHKIHLFDLVHSYGCNWAHLGIKSDYVKVKSTCNTYSFVFGYEETSNKFTHTF